MSIIDVEFAKQLVALVHSETKQNVHIFGEGGKIIATTQSERLGTIHEGAREIMGGKIDSIAVTQEMAEQMSGARPGFSVGIDAKDQRIGAIGISGDPEKMKPIAMVASHMAVLEHERKYYLSHLNVMGTEINQSLQESSTGLRQLSSVSGEQTAAIAELEHVVKSTKNQVMSTGQIVEMIRSISKQTTILGISAAIEAARLGTEGQGFNLVATEVRKLADYTSQSVDRINEVLEGIHPLVENVSNNIGTYITTSQQQNESVQALSRELDYITETVNDFLSKLSG